MPQTGPVTKLGKHRASMNSVKHGITSRTLLPCRKEACFYWLACSIKGEDGNLPEQLKNGDPCPFEIIVYRELFKRYRKMLGDDLSDNELKDIHQLVFTEIRLLRVYSALAIHPEITRKVSKYERAKLTLPFRYWEEIRKDWYTLIGKLFPQYTMIDDNKG